MADNKLTLDTSDQQNKSWMFLNQGDWPFALKFPIFTYVFLVHKVPDNDSSTMSYLVIHFARWYLAFCVIGACMIGFLRQCLSVEDRHAI